MVGEGIIKTAMKLIVMTESKEEIVKKVCEMFNNLSTDPVAKTEITDSPEIDQLLVLIDHVNSNISSAALACYFRLGGVFSFYFNSFYSILVILIIFIFSVNYYD